MSLLSGISYGGVTYFNNLIPSLAKVDNFNEYHIFDSRDGMLSKRIRQKNFIFHICPPYVGSTLMRFLWEQLILPYELKKRKIDIMFTAKNGNIFFAPCKTVIAIRNMEPFCYKNYENEWALNVFSWLRRKFTLVSIKKADLIIAVSKSVKQYLKDHFSSIGEKIHVIYNGNPLKGNSNINIRNDQKETFFLSASKFVAYANQLNLVEGYAILYEKKKDLPPLWFAGGAHDESYFKKIERRVIEKKLTDKIRFLGLLPHEKLIEMYTQAYAFIFPSLLEACPQTLIEAMACGTPIIASNVPPMPEICGSAAIYFDPYDREDISCSLERFLGDQNLRESLKRESLERCKFFDWKKTAEKVIEAFEKVHRNNPK